MSAQGKRPTSRTSSNKAIPSYGHLSLVELMKNNYLKYVISTNCDGLHLKSGIDKTKLVEIHGNTNIEMCENCHREFCRDESVRNHSNDVHDHFTGRMCPECGGKLNDTIINFNENLYDLNVEKAYSNARTADLMLVLGSSLRISVWAVDEVVQNPNANLVIINLQKTPFDNCALVIHERTDKVMQMVMTQLKLEIPQWTLHRSVQIFTAASPTQTTLSEDNISIMIKGVDQIGQSYNFIPAIQVHFGDKQNTLSFKNNSNLPYIVKAKLNMKKVSNVNIKLFFVGNYSETPFELQLPFSQVAASTSTNPIRCELFWDPIKNQWRSELKEKN